MVSKHADGPIKNATSIISQIQNVVEQIHPETAKPAAETKKKKRYRVVSGMFRQVIGASDSQRISEITILTVRDI